MSTDIKQEKDEYYMDVCILFSKSKANDDQVFNFIASYFENVSRGDHILFRDFRYISETLHNKQSFIHQFSSSIFHSFYAENANISADEIHQLLCLLCPNFPSSIILFALQFISAIDLKTIAQETHSKSKINSYEFKIIADAVLNTFLYWDIIQHMSGIFVNNEKPGMKYHENVFIGEIRSSISEFQLQYPSKEDLCQKLSSKISKSLEVNEVSFHSLCAAVILQMYTDEKENQIKTI